MSVVILLKFLFFFWLFLSIKERIVLKLLWVRYIIYLYMFIKMVLKNINIKLWRERCKKKSKELLFEDRVDGRGKI